jgi:hypothetical protein
VYGPAIITSQQAWLNPLIDFWEGKCVDAYKRANNGQAPDFMYASTPHARRRLLQLDRWASGGGVDGSGNEGDEGDSEPHGPEPAPPAPPRALCLRAANGEMLHLGEGSVDECHAHHARRSLLGVSDPSVVVYSVADAATGSGNVNGNGTAGALDGGTVEALARAVKTLQGTMEPFNDVAAALKPAVEPLEVRWRVVCLPTQNIVCGAW